MIFKNLKIVTPKRVLENAFLVTKDKKIILITKDENKIRVFDDKEILDCKGLVAMPGFIDIHIHGSMGIDFMDAKAEDYKIISESLYKEGVTTYLATTLTSDQKSLERVCREVKKAKKDNPSLGGIHFEGPYINAKHKGAQNEAFIRDPSIDELSRLINISGKNVRYISMAPEKNGALEFIDFATKNGVCISAGHTDASFDDVEKAISVGLTNTTHTHNAMSGHHHRNPGVVSAAMYFDELYTEMICDKIHVCPNSLKTFYKIVGPDRFIIITDALKIKHSDIDTFQLFGLDCVRKDGAAYLTSGPLAGSLLTLDQGMRNVRDITGASLVDLAKISSTNAAKSLHFKDRGFLQKGKLADFVLLDDKLNVKQVYKLGKRVY
mgnify:CR=1 FL=1